MSRILIGDSIAVGTAQALGCKVDARVGAPSDEVLRRMVSAAGYTEVGISVGSNDPTNPRLATNVTAIRSKVDADSRVVWILPQPGKFPIAYAVVRAEAAKYNDGIVLPTQLAADGVHPNYPAAAVLVRAEFARISPKTASGDDSLKPFFDIVRKQLHFGTINQSQVDGWKSLLSAVPVGFPIEWSAYCLATAYHETAATMQPIEEYGKGVGKAYGSLNPKTGQRYYGRGYVQLTWLFNYQKATTKLGVDFVNRPADVMIPKHAATILFTGMKEGWFTGMGLSLYFNTGKNDSINARRIVNGTDAAVKISGNYKVCLSALQAIGFVPGPGSSVVAVQNPSGFLDRVSSLIARN